VAREAAKGKGAQLERFGKARKLALRIGAGHALDISRAVEMAVGWRFKQRGLLICVYWKARYGRLAPVRNHPALQRLRKGMATPIEEKSEGLRFGAFGANAQHLCVDMQRLFAEETPWRTSWMDRVAPKVEAIVAARPAQTLFTRFIPAAHAGEGRGAWARYWERWAEMTLDELDPALLAILPELVRRAPDAPVIDKKLYSPWSNPALGRTLDERACDALVISGCETDVCVLAAVMGAVDRGYRVIIAKDAVCSSSDETHVALMTLYAQRYGQQIEIAETQEVLGAWSSR
jgi:nicotinamidase-related amidase